MDRRDSSSRSKTSTSSYQSTETEEAQVSINEWLAAVADAGIKNMCTHDWEVYEGLTTKDRTCKLCKKREDIE